jgi:hypothetical protein
MLKNLLFGLTLMTGLCAADTWQAKPHQYRKAEEIKITKVANIAEFPEFIDKTWQLASISNGIPYYINLKELSYDKRISATVVFVKQFDFPSEKIRIMKYAFRNKGTEFAGMGMNIYDGDNNYIAGSSVKPSELKWSPVMPGTVASDIVNKVREFLEYVQKEHTKDKLAKGSKSTTKA